MFACMFVCIYVMFPLLPSPSFFQLTVLTSHLSLMLTKHISRLNLVLSQNGVKCLHSSKDWFCLLHPNITSGTKASVAHHSYINVKRDSLISGRHEKGFTCKESFFLTLRSSIRFFHRSNCHNINIKESTMKSLS